MNSTPDRDLPPLRRLARVCRASLLALIPVAGAACFGGRSEERVGQGVLIIAIDGLRADHLSSRGYDRETSPNLDELSARGVSFTWNFSSAPWLVPAHVALLTASDPNVAWRDLPESLKPTVERRWRIPVTVPHMAVEFLARGFRTAAFVDHEWLSPVFGFERGFQEFEASQFNAPPRPGGSGAAGLVRRVESWIQSIDRSEDWMAYLHLHDLQRNWQHPDTQWDTYFEPRPDRDEVPPVGNVEPVFFAVPPSRWLGGSESLGVYEARYDGAIRRLDDDLRGLFDTMDLLDRYEDTTICVVGTYGIQFGEAGMIVDSGSLSVADLQVPWILKPARGRADFRAGAQIDAVSSSIDVAPTLLDLVGIPTVPGMHGVSQVPVLEGREPSVRNYAFASCGVQKGYAVFGDRLAYEFVYPGRAETEGLVRSWFGDERDHVSEYVERLYDARANPYPDLSIESADSDAANPLHDEAVRWFSRVDSLRRQAQTGWVRTEQGENSLWRRERP